MFNLGDIAKRLYGEEKAIRDTYGLAIAGTLFAGAATGLYGSYKRNQRVRKQTENGNPCGLFVTSIPSGIADVQSYLKSLNIGSNAAYICSADSDTHKKLFYMNKREEKYIQLDIDNSQFSTFAKKMHLDRSIKDTLSYLSDEDLKVITSITRNVHNERDVYPLYAAEIITVTAMWAIAKFCRTSLKEDKGTGFLTGLIISGISTLIGDQASSACSYIKPSP